MTHHDNDWKRAHDELVRIAAERATLDHDEGCWLLVAGRARVHERFGFATFAECVERVLGYGPRVTEEKLRVAEALQRLPVLAAALAAGDLSWSAVRELTRVAVGETERDWLTAARSRTVREVERLVSGRRPGDTPADPAHAEARRHTLRFDVVAETLATFREATAKLRPEEVSRNRRGGRRRRGQERRHVAIRARELVPPGSRRRASAVNAAHVGAVGVRGNPVYVGWAQGTIETGRAPGRPRGRQSSCQLNPARAHQIGFRALVRGERGQHVRDAFRGRARRRSHRAAASRGGDVTCRSAEQPVYVGWAQGTIETGRGPGRPRGRRAPAQSYRYRISRLTRSARVEARETVDRAAPCPLAARTPTWAPRAQSADSKRVRVRDRTPARRAGGPKSPC